MENKQVRVWWCGYRWPPAPWCGGRLTVTEGPDGGPSKLWWCSRRLIVTRFEDERHSWWWVPGVAVTLRWKRMQWQWL